MSAVFHGPRPVYHVIGSHALACAMLAGLACSGGPEAHTAVSDPVPPRPAPPDAAAAAMEPALSEAAARALLAQHFRAAGFRIVYDVRITRGNTPDVTLDVTLDGFDPAAQVGFEYLAESERERDVTGAERDALMHDPSARVLVIDAAAPADLERQAERFLQAVKAP